MNLLTIRLWDQHLHEDVLCELLQLLKNNRPACDEVWLTTEMGFPPREVHSVDAVKMGEAAEKFRQLGIIASLQISNTIGHGDYLRHLDFCGMKWRKMVGPDGTVAAYSSCPRDPKFLRYIYDTTKEYSRWKPDTVWVDDDLRMANHKPVDNGCFCDSCLEEFSQLTGRKWTRTELAEKINDPEDWTWRRRWAVFGSSSLDKVMEAVVKATLSVSPDSRFGLQHASWDWAAYGGKYYQTLADVVMKLTGKKLKYRPGAGYYNDSNPMQMIGKGMIVNLCTMLTRGLSDDIRPEIESFPHTALNKTAHGLAIETSLYLAQGSDAMTYAIMVVPNERPGYFHETLQTLGKWRLFWLRYLEHNTDTKPAGLGLCFTPDHALRPLTDKDKKFAWSRLLQLSAYGLTAFGLPISYYKEQPGMLLHPDMARSLAEKELAVLFAGGVLTDGTSIEILNERGLNHLTGVKTEPAPIVNGAEKLTDHPMNGSYAGRQWIQYLISGLTGMHTLFCHNPDTGIIGNYITNDGSENGIASLITTTPQGGRLAVFGYNLWESTVNTARHHQILAAADWVCGEKLPVVPETTARINVIPRTDSEGKLVSVFILNNSIDNTPELTVRLRNPRGNKAVWVRPDKADVTLNAERCEGELLVGIPPVEAWNVGVIEIH